MVTGAVAGAAGAGAGVAATGVGDGRADGCTAGGAPTTPAWTADPPPPLLVGGGITRVTTTRLTIRRTSTRFGAGVAGAGALAPPPSAGSCPLRNCTASSVITTRNVASAPSATGHAPGGLGRRDGAGVASVVIAAVTAASAVVVAGLDLATAAVVGAAGRDGHRAARSG